MTTSAIALDLASGLLTISFLALLLIKPALLARRRTASPFLVEKQSLLNQHVIPRRVA